MDCSMPGFPVLRHLPELPQMSNESKMPYSLSSPSLPAFNLFQHQGFFLMSQLFTSGGPSIRVSASVFRMNTQGISFRIDWFDFLAVQGTLKSLLQHHSLKTSHLWCSDFFMVQDKNKSKKTWEATYSKRSCGQKDSAWRQMNIWVSVRRMLCELRTRGAHNLRATYALAA